MRVVEHEHRTARVHDRKNNDAREKGPAQQKQPQRFRAVRAVTWVEPEYRAPCLHLVCDEQQRAGQLRERRRRSVVSVRG